MAEFIDVHSHMLNFHFVPDAFFKVRAPIREKLLRKPITAGVSRLVTGLMPGRKYDKLNEVLDMMRKDIRAVARWLADGMDDAGIVLSTPHMMDLEAASFGEKPEIPYRYQMMLISDIAAEYPGKIMPFVMFDPRRRSVVAMIKRAVEEMGFLGVKMYPPLGYHPDPSAFLNGDEVNRALDEVYEYCESESVPITTHCSRGGAYSGDLIKCRELVEEFCQPVSWEAVLKRYPKLRLNLAHFGGDEEFLKIERNESWAKGVRELIGRYENVYADTAYHDSAVDKKKSKKYFEILNRLMEDDVIRKRIVFGTDWLMTRHTWVNKAFTKAFAKLEPAKLKLIAMENPLNFLFPEGKLPVRMKRFFESRDVSADRLPEWMR